MSSDRPGVLAVRAVNEYRHRDVFAYLALRYYLANSASRSDEWARRVATQLVLTRTQQPYFPARHYKVLDYRSRGLWRSAQGGVGVVTAFRADARQSQRPVWCRVVGG